MDERELEVIRFATRKLLKGIKGELPLAVLARALAHLPGWEVREGSTALPLFGFLAHNETPETASGKDLVLLRAFGRLTPPGHYFHSPLVASEPLRIGLTRESRAAGVPLCPLDTLRAKVHPVAAGVKSPPSVEDNALYARGIRLVTPPPGEWAAGYEGQAHYVIERAWVGVPTWEIVAPDGTSAHVIRWHLLGAVRVWRKGRPAETVEEPAEPVYDKAESVWTWLYKPERKLAESVRAWLATIPEAVREQAVQPPSERDATNTGECQICARRQKLTWRGRTPLLVDHGFEFPDSDHWRGGLRGVREGSCFGVGYLPYEWGTDAIVKYLKSLAHHLQSVEQHLQALRTGTLPLHVEVRAAWEEVYELVVRPDGALAVRQYPPPGEPLREPVEEPVVAGQRVKVSAWERPNRYHPQGRRMQFEATIPAPRYAAVLAQKIDATERSADAVRDTIRDYETRRDQWKKKPLRGNPEGVPPAKTPAKRTA